MTRDASRRSPGVQRALIAVAVTVVGAAVGAGAQTASAEAGGPRGKPSLSPGSTDTQTGLQALSGPTRHITGPIAGIRPNPLAGTGVDPLDNGVESQIADFKPLNSKALTGPVAQAKSLGAVPVVAKVTGRPGGERG